MSPVSKLAFVRGQGFLDAEAPACTSQYGALMFQPRAIGILFMIGAALQRGEWFLALSAILWWNVLVPALNPFDALYNAWITGPRRLPQLGPAPAPRRFAQGMAATFMLLIGISLLQGWQTTAWILEGLIAIALLALIFGRFCLGSAIFNVFRKPNTPASAGSAHPN